jgi:hypothetical protein
MLNDSLKVTGHITLKLKDSSGNIKDIREVDNLVVNGGLEHVADQLCASPAQAKITKMGVGTGTTDVSGGQIALTTEHGDGKQLLDSTYPKLHDTDLEKVVYRCTYAAGDMTGSITEAGLFTGDVAPVMFARQKFDPITKGSNDILEITWTVTAG